MPLPDRLVAEPVLAHSARLGEGPLWDDRRGVLWWVDILSHEMHAFHPDSGLNQTRSLGQMVGAVALWDDARLMTALQHGFHALDLATGALSPWADPEAGQASRLNDGKCDPQGRFWAGSMATDGRKASSALYCLLPDGRCERAVDGVTISNGLDWSPDGSTMYYIDTPTGSIDAFAWDGATGRLGGRRAVVTFQPGEGGPDGMTLDAEGRIWVAHWGGSCVTCRDPESGRVLARVDVPAPHVSSCVFGGPNLDTLYITTARAGMEEEALAAHPQAGMLFAVRPGATGRPAFRFAGR